MRETRFLVNQGENEDIKLDSNPGWIGPGENVDSWHLEPFSPGKTSIPETPATDIFPVRKKFILDVAAVIGFFVRDSAMYLWKMHENSMWNQSARTVGGGWELPSD